MDDPQGYLAESKHSRLSAWKQTVILYVQKDVWFPSKLYLICELPKM